MAVLARWSRYTVVTTSKGIERMRTVILLGFYSVSDAIGAQTGFVTSSSVGLFTAVVLSAVIIMDVTEYFGNMIRG